MGAGCTALAATLPPGAALAVGIPLGAALYLLLLRQVVPDGFGLLVRPLLDLRRRITVPAGLSLLLSPRSCWPGAADAETPRRVAAPAIKVRVRRSYYVAPGGSDAGPGTRERPFGTIAQRSGACARPAPVGTRRDLRRAGQAVAAPGRKARACVPNFPGERPVLRGQLWIGDPSYWTIRGLNVEWAAGNPDEPLVRIYGGTGWRLTHSEIWGSHSTSGLQVDDGPRNNLGRWMVKGNCVHDTYSTDPLNQDHNVYLGDMSESPRPHGVISHNILFNAENGRGIKLGPGGPTAVRST